MSDVVVELGCLLDGGVVERVDGMLRGQEMGLGLEGLQMHWTASGASKEVALTRLEFEELAWRGSGKVTEEEAARIVDLINLGRYTDDFSHFKALDKHSFYEFMGIANEQDDRISVVEDWLCRKE